MDYTGYKIIIHIFILTVSWVNYKYGITEETIKNHKLLKNKSLEHLKNKTFEQPE